ncbi:four helix bundle protein [Flaviaesturariibacter aridisoli]|uniref:Four helix bundle protein n=1 Tax=Flaviaesturariibacter aridisoli TaxID=2545761 RepID=A0A4R4E3U7_9BACT|nr:four helix bundle protein [Flaviaesturariibacter aridisoli]TCZ73607.1 four helix bundle protein [Flaviaesturariibacter aridisoli]
MNRELLEKRTNQFHVDVLRLCKELPKDAAGFETGKQVIRSAGSVGANYRASRRSKSDKDFLYKMEVVLEEADESHYWLGVIGDSQMIIGAGVLRLTGEANELTAIFAAVCKTTKAKLNAAKKTKKEERKSRSSRSQDPES